MISLQIWWGLAVVDRTTGPDLCIRRKVRAVKPGLASAIAKTWRFDLAGNAQHTVREHPRAFHRTSEQILGSRDDAASKNCREDFEKARVDTRVSDRRFTLTGACRAVIELYERIAI
jgi:hypothetical protein